MRPLEKPQADPFFQAFDATGYRGLRQSDRLGCDIDAARVVNGRKHLDRTRQKLPHRVMLSTHIFLIFLNLIDILSICQLQAIRGARPCRIAIAPRASPEALRRSTDEEE
jgi:hypothetical protein